MKQSIAEISEQLVHLLQEKLGVPSSCLVTSNWDEPLTGSVIQLSGVNLVYLFFETEKYFRVRVDEQYLMSYGFCSINQVARVIEQTIGTEKANEKKRVEVSDNNFQGSGGTRCAPNSERR